MIHFWILIVSFLESTSIHVFSYASLLHAFLAANVRNSPVSIEASKYLTFGWNKSIFLIGLFFWDYGNAFLLEAKRAGADVAKPGEDDPTKATIDFRYPSYVQDIMG